MWRPRWLDEGTQQRIILGPQARSASHGSILCVCMCVCIYIYIYMYICIYGGANNEVTAGTAAPKWYDLTDNYTRTASPHTENPQDLRRQSLDLFGGVQDTQPQNQGPRVWILSGGKSAGQEIHWILCKGGCSGRGAVDGCSIT